MSRNFGRHCVRHPQVSISQFIINPIYPLVLIRNTQKKNSVLEKAGVIESPEGGFQISEFVNTSVAELI